MTIFKNFCLMTALTLLLSGCGAAQTKTTNVAANKPSLEVSANVIGNTATLKISTDLKLSQEHYDHERKQGEGHIHLSLDEGEKIVVFQKDYPIEHLTKGPHSVKLSLHNNDHTPYDVSKTISFDVK